MARSAMSRSTRRANVATAARDLPALLVAAECASSDYGDDDPRTLAAWERVETVGATVHRQSRILAGKSRGG